MRVWYSILAAALLGGVASFANAQAKAFTMQGPSSVHAGQSANLTITAVDDRGKAERTYEGNKILTFSGSETAPDGTSNPTITDANGTARPFGSSTTLDFNKGVATAKGSKNGVMRLYHAGQSNVSVTDGNISSTQDLSVSVLPGSLSGFGIDFTSPQTSGTPFTGTNTISALDPYGNPVSSFNAASTPVTVTTSLSGSVSGLGSSNGNVLNSSTDFSGGVADVSGQLTYTGSPGDGTFTANGGGVSGSSSTVSMQAGAVLKLVFVQQPATTVAGAVISPAVTVGIRDPFGNSIHLSNVSVTIALQSGTGTLKGTTTRATDNNGIATFNDLSISDPGSKVLSASAKNYDSGLSNSFTITAAAGTRLTIGIQPSTTATAGVVLTRQPVVRIEDAAGTLVTTDNTTVVTASPSTGATTLRGTASVKAVGGLVTFTDLALTKAGIAQLTFSAPSLTSATSSNVQVVAASPSALAFTQQPSNAAAGASITPPVAVQTQDDFGNTSTQSGIAVTLTLASGTGPLQGTTQKLTDNAGTASFADLHIDVAGQKTLAASAPGLRSAASESFAITSGTPTQLAFQQQPTTVAVGARISPPVTVVVRDAAGNTLPTNTIQITLTLTGSGALTGTLVKSTINGVATFDDLGVTQPGVKALNASAPDLTPATSVQFTATQGPASLLAFVTQPGDIQAGTPFVPPVAVQLLDAFGNPITADSVTVTMTLNGTGTLQGPTAVLSRAGVATFNGLSVTALGRKTLTASASGAGVVQSGPFTVHAGRPARISAIEGSGQTTPVGTAFSSRLKAGVYDSLNNPVSGVVVTFTLPLSGASGSFEGGVSTATTDSSGIATAAQLTANSIAGSFTVTASATELPHVASFTLGNDSTAGPITIAPASGTPQETMVGTQFHQRLQAVVSNNGKPVPGVLVRFQAPVSEASCTFGQSFADSAVTDASGTATSGMMTAGTMAGTYDVSASTGKVSTAFRLTNTPGPLVAMRVEAENGGAIDTQVVSRQFGVRISALDQYGNVATSFNQKAVLTSDGQLASGEGETEGFVNGVLPSHSVSYRAAGSFVLIATRSGGSEGGTSNRFVVANPRPTITSVSPSTLHPGDKADVTITGTGFLSGVTVVTIDSALAIVNVRVSSPTQLTASVSVSGTASTGSYGVTVSNPAPGGGSSTLQGGIRIGGNPIPSVSSVDPRISYQGQRLMVVVQGDGFMSGVTAAQFSGAGIAVESTHVDSPSRLSLQVLVAADAGPGVRDVIVTNPPPGGGSVNYPGAFTVSAASAAIPVAISPADGATSQPVTLTLQWQDVPGISRYQLQVAHTADFAAPLVTDDSTIAGASFTVGPLDGGARYYWRVRSMLGPTASAWSKSRAFQVTPVGIKTLTVTATLSFPYHNSPGEYTSADYRLVGMPGAGKARLAAVIPGTQGQDWQAYWDNGAADSGLVVYDGRPVFTFADGRGFWLIKRGMWQISATVDAMPVDSLDQSVNIPLHPGWNIITDPFTWTLDWPKIRDANGITEELYGFNGGFFISHTLEPTQAYYFFADSISSLGSLRVPVFATPDSVPAGARLSRTAASGEEWTIGVALEGSGIREDVVRLGVRRAASAGKDRYDVHKPRTPGASPGLALIRPEWDHAYPAFASDIRPLFADSASWHLSVAAPQLHAGTYSVSFHGMEEVPDQWSVYLLDRAHGHTVDLRQTPSYHFTPDARTSDLTVVVGRKEAISDILSAITPRVFALEQNYPNPFNPSTVIPVSIPIRSEVSLRLYDALGREVKTLLQTSLDAGRYFVTWDGTEGEGRPVAAGVYFCRLQTGNGFSMVRKLLLVR